MIDNDDTPIAESRNPVFFLRAADGRCASARQPAGAYVLASDCASYFEAAKAEDGKLLLRSAHGLYLSARPDGTVGSSPTASGWEAFSVEHGSDGMPVLRSFHGTYLVAGAQPGTIALASQPATGRCLTLAPAFDPVRYRTVARRTGSAGPTERTVWTFWHQGAERMSAFYRLNVECWHRLLGPRWRIEVLNVVGGDGRNVHRFVDAADLPATFARLSPVTQSEAMRLALLKRRGGVWMDASIILLRSLEDICWKSMADLEQDVILSGFCNTGWGSDHLDRKDYFESWFIAARRDNAFLDEWHRVFVAYWNDRIVSSASWAHPLFESLDLSNFNRYGKDFRNYLLAHIAFRRVLEHDAVMREIWRRNMLLRDAGDEGFYLTRVTGWDPDHIYRKLLEEKDVALADRLLATCLMKFTSSMAGQLAELTRAELLDERHTLGTIYARLLAPIARSM